MAPTRTWFQPLLVAIAVLLAARISYSLNLGGVVSLWLPSGLVLGLLLLTGRRAWPRILIGAYVGNLVMDLLYVGRPFLIVFAPLANVLEALLAASLLRAALGRANPLHSLRGAGLLIVGCAVASNALTA